MVPSVGPTERQLNVAVPDPSGNEPAPHPANPIDAVATRPPMLVCARRRGPAALPPHSGPVIGECPSTPMLRRAGRPGVGCHLVPDEDVADDGVDRPHRLAARRPFLGLAVEGPPQSRPQDGACPVCALHDHGCDLAAMCLGPGPVPVIAVDDAGPCLQLRIRHIGLVGGFSPFLDPHPDTVPGVVPDAKHGRHRCARRVLPGQRVVVAPMNRSRPGIGLATISMSTRPARCSDSSY